MDWKINELSPEDAAEYEIDAQYDAVVSDELGLTIHMYTRGNETNWEVFGAASEDPLVTGAEKGGPALMRAKHSAMDAARTVLARALARLDAP